MSVAKGIDRKPVKIPPLAFEMGEAPVPNLQHPPGVNILGIPIPVFGKMPPGKVQIMPPKLVKKAPPPQPMPKMQPKNLFGNGGAVSASDVTGWLGKIGGVISDIFVPGSSIALEAAMDNLGSAIDDYIAEKKAAAATKAWLKIKRDVQSNPAFTDWQKNQILNLMNQIQLANTAGNTDKVKELQTRISKLRAGDYHDSAQYKQFRQLIDSTGLDTQSKSIIFGWLDDAKNPANDLTDAQRQSKWDNITAELTKAQIASQTGKKQMLGNAPTAEQVAAHMTKLEKQAGLSSSQASGGTIDVSRIIELRFNRAEWGMGEYFQMARDLMGHIGPRHFINDGETVAISYEDPDPHKQYYEYKTYADINGRPLEYSAIMKGIPRGGGKPKRAKGAIAIKAKNAKKAQGSEIHSVVFPKKYWSSISEMKNWLRNHGYKAEKIDETDETYRFRQKKPELFMRFATKVIEDKAYGNKRKINLVIGFHKARASSMEDPTKIPNSSKIKAVSFPQSQWNIEQSMNWMKEHEIPRGSFSREDGMITFGKVPTKAKFKKIKTQCKDVEIVAGMIIGE